MSLIDIAAAAALTGTVCLLRSSLRGKEPYLSPEVVAFLILAVFGFHYLAKQAYTDSEPLEEYTVNLYLDVSGDTPDEDSENPTQGDSGLSPMIEEQRGSSSESYQETQDILTGESDKSFKQRYEGNVGNGIPSTSCGLKRGGRPLYMFGVGM